MSLNKEQITLVAAAVIFGGLTYLSVTATPAPQKKERKPLLANNDEGPMTALPDALFGAGEGSWSGEGRNIYAAPTNEESLPPVNLPAPPRSLFPRSMPQPIPGVDPYSRIAYTKTVKPASGVKLPPRAVAEAEASDEEEELPVEGATSQPAALPTSSPTTNWKERMTMTAQQRLEEEKKKAEAAAKELERKSELDVIRWMNGDQWFGQVVNDFATPRGSSAIDRFALKLKIDAVRGDSTLTDDQRAKMLGDREYEIRFRQDKGGKLGRPQQIQATNIRSIEFAKTPVNMFQVAKRTTPKSNVDAHLALARSLIAAGEWTMATEHLVQMLDDGVAQREVYTALYDAAEGAFDHDAAVRALTDGLSRFPDDPELLGGLADLYARFGLDTMAQSTFAKVAGSGSRLPKITARQGRFALSRGFRRRGDAATVVDLLSRVADARFESLAEKNGVMCDLASAHLGGGNLQEARRIYDDVLKIDANHIEALLGLGAIEFLGGKYAEAKTRFAAAVALRPDDGRARYNLALAAIAMGDWLAARDGLHDAMTADPLLSSKAYAALSYLYECIGEVGEATSAAESAAEADPQDPEVMLTLARSYVLRGDWDRAQTSYERAAGLLPDHFEALMGMAECAFHGQKLDVSLRYTDAALGMAPKLPALLIRRAQILVRLNRLADAKKSLDEAKTLQPGSEVDVNHAYYYYSAGNFTEARSSLQRILQDVDAKDNSPFTAWAKTWFAAIDDNMSKRVWTDHFNRSASGAEIGYGWVVYSRASGFRPNLVKNQIAFTGVQKQTEMPTTIYQEIPSQELTAFECVVEAKPTDEYYVGIGILRFQRRSGRDGQETPYVGKETDAPASEGLLFAKAPDGKLAYRVIQNGDAGQWKTIDNEVWPDAAGGVAMAITVVDAKKNLYRLSIGGRSVGQDLEVKGFIRAGQTCQLWIFTQAEIDKKIDAKIDDAKIIKRKG